MIVSKSKILDGILFYLVDIILGIVDVCRDEFFWRFCSGVKIVLSSIDYNVDCVNFFVFVVIK